MKNRIIFKTVFSSFFFIIAILKVSWEWFYYRMDITFVGIILIAFLPWFSEYLKSIEAFGVKAEFISDKEKEKIDKEANRIIENNQNITKEYKNINIIKNVNKIPRQEKITYTINSIEDPIERLVLIRHEIEKYLRNICEAYFNSYIYFKNIKSMADELYEDNIISPEVRNLIFDLMPVLNRAVHADLKIKEYDNIKWVEEKGILVIIYLEMILEKKDNKK